MPFWFTSQSEQSEREQIVDQVVDDGAKIGDGEKRTLLHRKRKSAKNNVMVSLSEAESHRRKVSSSFAGFFFFFFNLSDR